MQSTYNLKQVHGWYNLQLHLRKPKIKHSTCNEYKCDGKDIYNKVIGTLTCDVGAGRPGDDAIGCLHPLKCLWKRRHLS